MLKRVLEKMFKGGIDSVAQGYIETILKSSRHWANW